jgi:hypothetical protein
LSVSEALTEMTSLDISVLTLIQVFRLELPSMVNLKE